MQGNGTGKDFVKAYDTVNFADGQGTTAVVTTSADGKTSTIKFNTPLTYMDNTGAATTTPSNAVSFVGANSSKPVAVQNVASGLVDNSTGSTVTLDNATGAILNNAVNVGDLKNVIDSVNTSVANSGFTLTANGQNGSKVTPNATVNMKNTDGNIKISKTATSNDVTYDLNPNLDLGSTGSLKTGDSTVNNNGVTINNGAAGSPVSLTKNGLDNGGNKITNVAAGDISATSTDAVNGSQLYQIAQHITNNVTTSSPVQYSNSSNPTAANGGMKSNDVTLVGLNSDPVTLHNVAPGRAGTDVVNVNQLGQVAGNLNNRINKVADEADAGTAAAMAAAGLPQTYLPGKSMVAVSGSTYRGKQGYAVGMSAITDGGNWIIKGIATGNSEGHFGATIGAGYQW